MALQRLGAHIWRQKAARERLAGVLRPAFLAPSFGAFPSAPFENAARDTQSDSTKLAQAQVQATTTRAPLVYTGFSTANADPRGTTTTSRASAPHVEGRSAVSVAAEYALRNAPRKDWSKAEIQAIFDSPLMDLLFHGAEVHRHFHRFREVQQCTLLSIKTGGCSEDCSYCPQSSRYTTGVKAEKLMAEDTVIAAARRAKEAGSTRFCMGAAWRDTIGRKTNFNQILTYVKEIRGMGMEVCCTLGMIEEAQARQLREAGLTAYNHNLDTSREFYPSIITTRSYDDRLQTLKYVRDAGISVCSGGIIGMGEAAEDRVGLIHTLATLPEHPESVPINALLAVPGTPLQDQKPVEVWEMIRMIATARVTMPTAMVRLSAGRVKFSLPEQALCFMAGANSIFTGEKLLTTPNNDYDQDQQMFKTLGLVPKPPNFMQGADREAAELSGQQEEEQVAAAAM
ncbi:Biotin synthase [Klebsormidium nitens]|uniref:biotin synthase n=1 Tax=Klebsormidium nitens TaxID=105231 RepID=A0A1Y1IJ21_KLENI|nr:Biotin synthase [Klebsormidium nitens]|eukprot:GAQ90112.1 Biotin synthase [Klebsormidium nitens]